MLLTTPVYIMATNDVAAPPYYTVAEARSSNTVFPFEVDLVSSHDTQEWFWTETWQKMEKEADAAKADGRERSFDNLESLLAALENN